MRRIVITSIGVFLSVAAFAQQAGWQHKDLQADGIPGIGTEKLYHSMLKGKKPKPVVVAIIDSGIDTLQEDLKTSLWTNNKDGAHGWNFIGAETGKEDITYLTGDRKEFYDSLSYSFVPESYRAGYQSFRKMYPALQDKIRAMGAFVRNLEVAKEILHSMTERMGKDDPLLEDITTYQPRNEDEKLVAGLVIERWPAYKGIRDMLLHEVDDLIGRAQYHIDHGLNVRNEEPDTVRGDADISPDALGLFAKPNLTAWHGTNVAGIIGAARNNGIGLDGVADNVQLMMLKVIGNIRELRDKNLAGAIRYAVDNGAKVINLSFGKPYTWNKELVDSAVRYAMEKDVLIVHAAGNNGEDLDNVPHYPTPIYKDGKGRADAWIEVGASGPKDDNTLAPSFSNYGKASVDVFAPGVQIYSCVPGGYRAWDGTSMAAPMVAGVAALLREYFPRLTAAQIKDIIMQSVTKINHYVILKGQDGLRKVPFSDLCVSGGILNAYEAFELANSLNIN